jgi:lipopolysaccharide core heptose(I) kinase
MPRRTEPTCEIEPGGDDLLSLAGLDDPEAILTFDQGALVNLHATREVRSVEADGQRLFVKRHRNLSARSERDALRALAEHGVAAARPIALVEGAGASALVTLGIAGGRPLEDLVSHDLDRRTRRAIAGRTAALTARLHAEGFSFPDLYAKHVVLDGEGRPHLIDLERLERSATPGRRARDLAALDLTCSLAGASLTDRVAFLRAYIGARRLESRARDLAKRVSRARVKLARKRRFQRHLLTVPKAHRARLEAAGFATFGDFMTGAGIESVRSLPDRENVRLTAGDTVYFGKRVPAGHLADARREWENLVAFEREGLPGPSPAAFGTDPVEGGFVFTERVPGRPLDDLLGDGGIPAAEQRSVAASLGALVRRVHGLGFWHRDLYLCHVFAERGDAGWTLTLIDLGRVGRKPRPRARWLVKDLAALWHSTPKDIVAPRASVEFLRAYLGRRPLGAKARRLVERVIRKAGRMARHVPKWSGAGDQR